MTEFIRTNVAGVTFENEDGVQRQELIRQLVKPGLPVYLEREPSNSADPNAVIVFLNTPDNQFYQLGYLPRKIALIIAHRMDNREIVQGKITQILDVEDGTKGVEIELIMRVYETNSPPKNLKYTVKPWRIILGSLFILVFLIMLLSGIHRLIDFLKIFVLFFIPAVILFFPWFRWFIDKIQGKQTQK